MRITLLRKPLTYIVVSIASALSLFAIMRLDLFQIVKDVPIDQLRAPGHGHGNLSQLRFGFRKEAGKIVAHLGEQQVIGVVKDLRAEGMTLRQIAQRMTALRIPSKNGKIKWHPMMIKRILDSFKNEIESKA